MRAIKKRACCVQTGGGPPANCERPRGFNGNLIGTGINRTGIRRYPDIGNRIARDRSSGHARKRTRVTRSRNERQFAVRADVEWRDGGRGGSDNARTLLLSREACVRKRGHGPSTQHLLDFRYLREN